MFTFSNLTKLNLSRNEVDFSKRAQWVGGAELSAQWVKKSTRFSNKIQINMEAVHKRRRQFLKIFGPFRHYFY